MFIKVQFCIDNILFFISLHDLAVTVDFFVNGFHKGAESAAMTLTLTNMQHVNLGQYYDGSQTYLSSTYIGGIEFRDQAMGAEDIAQLYLRARLCKQ